MEKNNNETIDNALEIWKLDITFTSKPIIVGGLAMEYYGLRKRGNDIDIIMTNDDYHTLAEKYPKNKKDMWGDRGILIDKYELFRSIWKFDYNFYAINAIEYDEYMIISFDKLLLMKVMAMNADEKHAKDVDLIIKHYQKNQNQEYKKFMDDHIEKYISAPGGIVYNAEY